MNQKEIYTIDYSVNLFRGIVAAYFTSTIQITGHAYLETENKM